MAKLIVALNTASIDLEAYIRAAIPCHIRFREKVSGCMAVGSGDEIFAALDLRLPHPSVSLPPMSFLNADRDRDGKSIAVIVRIDAPLKAI